MMSKTQWMVLLMVGAIGVVGCSKSSEETAKDPGATKDVANAQGAETKEMVDAVKPAIKAMTEGMENNEAVANAVAAVASSGSLDKVIQDQSPTEEIVDVQKVAETKDVAAAAKPMLGALTEGMGNTQAVATAVEAVSSSDSRDKVIVDQLALMTAMTGMLEGVTDKESAEKSKPEFAKLNAKGEVLKARADKLGEPSQEEEGALKAKYGPQMEEIAGKLMAQMMRLSSKPETMAVLNTIDMSGLKGK
jgi:hypothetical protein